MRGRYAAVPCPQLLCTALTLCRRPVQADVRTSVPPNQISPHGQASECCGPRGLYYIRPYLLLFGISSDPFLLALYLKLADYMRTAPFPQLDPLRTARP